ncbi:cell division protein FtsK [Kineococcus radiotolerans]|uniref:Cell divisionFtsK/SpoIIIE n=1 Tax=Kineococcus radiotolerans (strain ATCC BAA-149 / DSM 14245 / SRS30216) TaxID=266940 RepID=A6WGZ5_KINRD|nr:cell division protein FtsK [Kineococcus radiotolerans]ABS06084.1 cell divisionFtsK/SpoIIIE [Kineococcus radiotolerans SRS30216 = ATCC BAA-149]
MPSLAQAAAATQERPPSLGGTDPGGSGLLSEPGTTMLTRTAALPPRPTTWPTRSLVCLAGAVAGYAAAPEVGYPKLSAVAAVLGGAASLHEAVHGVRSARRAALADDLTEALTPLLGLRKPSRRHVEASRWKPERPEKGEAGEGGAGVIASRWNGWWVGTPLRLKLAYARGVVNADHPKWKTSVLDTVSRLLGCDYVIVRHDTRKGVVQLRRKYRDASLAPYLELEVLRAERLVRSLLGPGARLTPEFDEMQASLESDDFDQAPAAGTSSPSEEATAVTRQIVALNVHHQAGTRVATAAQRARVERSMSAMMAGRWRARFQLHQDFVRFELRPTLPTRVPSPAPREHDMDPLLNYDRVEIPYAVDEDGATIAWRPAIDPMLMVVGPTGTGKTVLLHNIVARFAKWGWPVHIVDGKGIEFLGFREWPNVQTVATYVDEQVALIHAVWQIMEDRYAAVIAGEATETDFEPVVLILDEFRDFYGNVLPWYADIRVTGRGGDPSKPPVLEAVKSIARKGRSSRVHLVLGTQRPDADFLSGEARDNFRARVALGRLSPQGANMMWDSYTAGVSVPRIRGRGTTLGPAGNVIEVQTFWTPDPRKVREGQHDDLDILRALRPSEAAHERLVIVPPEPRQGKNDEEEDVRYSQWSRPYFQPSLTAGVGARPSEHLRDVARIIPLKLRPDLATRSLLSPALAAEWLPPNVAAEHDPADTDGIVIVEPDPRAGRFVSIEPAGRGPRQGQASRTRAADLLGRGEIDADDDSGEDLSEAGELDGSAGDPFDGYGDPVDLDVDELAAGYLVLVDDGTDHWAVLEGDPEEDFDEPDLRSLEWRDDQDDAASLTVDAGTLITARIPRDDDLEAEDSPARRAPSRASSPRAGGSRVTSKVNAPRGAEAAPRPSRPQRVRATSRRPPTAPAVTNPSQAEAGERAHLHVVR